MSEQRVTSRGFRVFGVRERLPEERLYGQDGSVSVVESSIAGRGAHVRIYECENCVQLNVTEAELVIEALRTFIVEAKADMLTEPAGGTEQHD